MVNYGQKPAVIEVVGRVQCNVYYRDKNLKLRAVKVDCAEDVQDAMLSVKELLISELDFWEVPMLAVITGGKK